MKLFKAGIQTLAPGSGEIKQRMLMESLLSAGKKDNLLWKFRGGLRSRAKLRDEFARLGSQPVISDFDSWKAGLIKIS
jgi:hypothetical protein